ncbi:MAG TPA: hypothetical protein VGK67_10965 [Myxococcales bacterium]|jgi:hypothetical protein
MPVISSRSHSVRATTKTASAGKTEAAGKVAIKPEHSDPGLKFTVNAKANSVTITGEAKGPKVVKDLSGYVDYEVARGCALSLDRAKMPNFDNEPDYRAKNKWYFAHTPSLDTREGQGPAEVAKALAAKINEGGAYKATVTVKGAAATISLVAR